MNITLMTKDLDTKKTAAAALLNAQMAAAEKDNRERTAEEIAAVDAQLADCKALKARIDRAQGDVNQLAELERMTAGMQPHPAGDDDARPARVERRSMGQQLVESPDYRAFIKAQMHRRAGSWVSPMMELHATTLTEGAGSGGALVVPQLLPGIVPLFFKKVMVGDLLPQGTTTSNALLYLQETTFTNAATPVLEGTAKPESALIFAQKTAPVQKLAHWLPVTEEMLEDVPAISAYIDARLRLGLDLTEGGGSIDAEREAFFGANRDQVLDEEVLVAVGHFDAHTALSELLRAHLEPSDKAAAHRDARRDRDG